MSVPSMSISDDDGENKDKIITAVAFLFYTTGQVRDCVLCALRVSVINSRYNNNNNNIFIIVISLPPASNDIQIHFSEEMT